MMIGTDFEFLYNGERCCYAFREYNEIMFRPSLEGQIIHVVPNGTWNKVKGDITLIIEMATYGKSIEEVLASRQFDNDLEELLNEK